MTKIQLICNKHIFWVIISVPISSLQFTLLNFNYLDFLLPCCLKTVIDDDLLAAGAVSVMNPSPCRQNVRDAVTSSNAQSYIVNKKQRFEIVISFVFDDC